MIGRRNGGVVLRIALLVGLGGCAPAPALPPTATAAPRTDSPQPTLNADEAAGWIVFRRQFGLRWDKEWLTRVAADPSSSNDTGIPLLASELDLVGQAVLSTQPMTSALTWYGEQHVDDYGGIRVEGRTVVIRLSRNIPQHRKVLSTLLGANAPFEVRASRYSLRELRDFAKSVEADAAWFTSVGALFVAADPAADRVRVRYRATTTDVEAAIADRYGSPDWLVFRREGPLFWDGPLGGMIIRVIGDRGQPVEGPGCRWTALDPAVQGNDAVAFTTDANGECRNDFLPATMYRVSVTRFEVGLGNVEVGSGQGAAPAGGLGQVTIRIPG